MWQYCLLLSSCDNLVQIFHVAYIPTHSGLDFCVKLIFQATVNVVFRFLAFWWLMIYGAQSEERTVVSETLLQCEPKTIGLCITLPKAKEQKVPIQEFKGKRPSKGRKQTRFLRQKIQQGEKKREEPQSLQVPYNYKRTKASSKLEA